MLIIKSYNDRYQSAWDEFVMNSSEASFFHLTGWKNAVEKNFGHKAHYAMAMRDEKICGILPLIEIKSRFFGHALVSIPYAVYGGIAALDKESHYSLRRCAETLAELIHVDYLELRNVCSSSLFKLSEPNAYLNSLGVPSDLNYSKWNSKNLYVTFKREIFDTVTGNLEAIPRKQRAMVRKGEKYGLSSKIGTIEDLEQFYGIYATNVRDLGSPVYPLSFLHSLMENFSDAFILSIWKGGEMVAGVLTFVHKDTLLPYYGGGLREYFEYAINDFMYWELMKYGCENGFKVFDFGRSKKETGSYRFKKHWGFEPSDLDYQCFLVKAKEMPNVSPVNPKYQFMISVWKRLPLAVTNWLGPKLVRGIP